MMTVVEFDPPERLTDNKTNSLLIRRSAAMKFLLFCCMEEKNWDTLSKSERDNLMQATMVYCEELRQNGQLLLANLLEPVEMAMTVRVRNGGVSLTDGPFAETKEQIGGFFLIEARDINQAVQIASKFPSVRLGSMEVRPLREMLRQGIEAESWHDA